MHTEREIKIITTVFISVLLITNTVLMVVIKEPLLACLIASLALIILYISAVVMVKRIYARIAGVRTAAKELSIRKSANNESEGLSAIKQEMLTEGEFGKLSGAIYDMYTGILEAADRLKVFERFSHSSDAASVNPDSVGIGLPLSKNIIEENGGRIYIESRFIDECKASEKTYTTVNIIFNNTMR